MSHHSSIQQKLPNSINLRNKPNLDMPQSISGIGVEISNELMIPGQGSIVFGIPEHDENNRSKEAHIELSNSEKNISVILKLTDEKAKFLFKRGAIIEEFTLKNPDHAIIKSSDGYTCEIDKNPKCIYWLSIDSLNKRLRYGKGEMRLSTTLLDYQYDYPKNLFTKDDPAFYTEIDDLKIITSSADIELLSMWKDPMVSEPPSHIVPSKDYAMDDVALGNKFTTVKALSEECQLMYANVCDFELNTSDFPDFGQAIEYSIRTKGCLGYRILQKKLKNSPFNKNDSLNTEAKEEEYKEIYLRITLGQSQGESPGIPYVMEIWPAACASPVHHHGFTHAIIKVLRGAIDVDIFRMLPGKHNSDKELATVVFEENDITYLMPEANQYHLLKNNVANQDTCITIQCYSYGKKDITHYATFDYIEEKEEGHFDPISDYDFIDFKNEIKKEWEAHLQERPWMGTEILK